MSFLEWDERYTLGIPEMDEQHQKWVSILNEFYSEIENDFTEKNIDQCLNKIIEYTQYHFNEEEKFMAAIGYTELKNQKNLHELLLLKMKEFKERLDRHKIEVLSQVVLDLEHWFYEHLEVEDFKYGKFYKNLKTHR